MVKKSLAWLVWAISLFLWLYDRGTRGLGWLAGPADFVQYIVTPWRDYAWPFLRDQVFAMLTLNGMLFTIATITLIWIYYGDRILAWLRARGIRSSVHWLSRRPITKPIIYIGEMSVSDQHMEDELFLEIAARGFNVAEVPIVIKRTHGYITCDTAQLPPPNLLLDRGPRGGVILARSEFIVVFEQRMPRTIVDRLTKLEAGKRVPLNFDKFNIVVEVEMGQNNEIRMPIYDGIMLYRDPSKLLTSRIINASITSGIRAGTR